MSRRLRYWPCPLRTFALLALSCAFAGPALALSLAADLSSHYIEVRTTFKGAQITVFGSVSGGSAAEASSGGGALSGADVVVVVHGPSETLHIRRKGRLGIIWANEASFTAKHVPSFYYVASTRPLDDILDQQALARYGIGFRHLGITMDEADNTAGAAQAAAKAEENRATSDDLLDVQALGQKENAPADVPTAVPVPMSPGAQAIAAQADEFRAALLRILEQRHIFFENGRLSVIRSQLFRTEVDIPSTVPAGAYNADIYLVKNHVVLDAESIPFFIDKKGIERDLYTLAMHHPILHGLLAVFIAVAFGWASEAAMRRR